ncbi:MAG: prolyl-tRNA synthetase associated domain-containing protein [Alphaproteobacteria bacterium]|nr:prolyl-tRNA synthetase associated domain-containing protein [Alphaproteobacteria bacterium]
MAATREDLFAHLAALGIGTETLEHPPVFTVEEARSVHGRLPGAHTKNLFLKDKAGALWLASMREEVAADLKALARHVGAKRFSFASPELLLERLGVAPGSVSPFALLSDTGRTVSFALDAGLLRAPALNFHPLTNEATTAIAPADFLRFLESLNVTPHLVDFAGLAGSDPR